MTIGGRVFRLRRRAESAWDVFEGGRLFGWFLLGGKDDRGRWLIADSETIAHPWPLVAITATTVGRTWADLCGDRDPHP